MPEPLSSPAAYQSFIYALGERSPCIRRSTLTYIPSGTLFGRVEGLLLFHENLVLCVYEYLNFELNVIEGYGYEVSRAQAAPEQPDIPAAREYCQANYPYKEKLFWYDSFPHPNDHTLAATAPHHKHVPPNIKHHRIPAPDLSFTRPNLPGLIVEVDKLGRLMGD